MPAPKFTREIVGTVPNPIGGADMNTLLAVGDVNGDGFTDVVVSGRNGRMVWLENPGRQHTPGTRWREHLVDDIANQECGGCTSDLLGRGRADVINGSTGEQKEIAWWENPGVDAPAGWPRRVIAHTGFSQIHDTRIGVVTGDGLSSLVFTNQRGAGGGRLWRVPLPRDPRVEPWPGLELIADNLWWPNPHTPGWVSIPGQQPEEGLAIGDVDSDGRNEIVCGCYWFKHSGQPGAAWTRHRFATGYITTKCAIADIDGDGRNEILLSEGDPVVYGVKAGGRFAVFHAPADPTQPWREERLAEGLLDAHTLQVGDICGNGRVDVLLGEIGVSGATRETYGAHRPPCIWVYENDGRGRLTPHLIDEGTGTHDSQLVDLRRTGVLDIVGKPLHGPHRWDVVVWYNQRAAQ